MSDALDDFIPRKTKNDMSDKDCLNCEHLNKTYNRAVCEPCMKREFELLTKRVKELQEELKKVMYKMLALAVREQKQMKQDEEVS